MLGRVRERAPYLALMVFALAGGMIPTVEPQAARAGDPVWMNRPGPSPRYDHAMAYDSARGVTVLFGGWDRGGLDCACACPSAAVNPDGVRAYDDDGADR
ncbi:MAG: hypothetical protein V2A79_10350 [Planctomycetota bacterium]